MMPLMSLTSLLNILRPNRAPAPAAGAPGDDRVSDNLSDNMYVDPTQPAGAGGYLVTRDGRTLPLRGVSLRADARGGVARVVLEQRFVNAYQEPLHVTYLMPLPAEAAVSGYAFVLAGRRITGEVDRKKKARQRFEQAILEGKTAGLVEQERSSLFTQELGNVPAGAEIVAELTLDQKLVWRREGAWEWRFPTAVGPRYVGAPGQVPDAARIAVAVVEGGTPARLALSVAIRDALPGAARPESPSHALRSSAAGASCEVRLADEAGAPLDRDVVVRWPVAAASVGTTLDVGRPAGQREAYGLLTLVPPEPARQRASRRDLILLLDTSGSMGGEPLRQLQRTSLALIDSLSDQDTLEMIEFSSTARRWARQARLAIPSVRREARTWVEQLRAGGGTEMVSGMLEALAPLTAQSQRQVILMTDGYIGQEREVITQVMAKLPRGSCRVHVVGVGSSVNRTLTAGVARAGAGVELILGPGEDAERLVGGLLARTAAPLVTHVEVRGEALLANAPAYLPDLYAGSPALISLQLRPEGGQLELSGHSAEGAWRQTLAVPACGEGQGTTALAQLFGRETVEDLELAHATTLDKHAEIDRAIEDLGLRYQISTRLTTWVAVSHDATVDPASPGRREVVPHEVPYGTSVSGLGLRQASGSVAPMQAQAMPMAYAPRSMGMAAGAPPRPGVSGSAATMVNRMSPMGGAPMGPPPSEDRVRWKTRSAERAEATSSYAAPVSDARGVDLGLDVGGADDAFAAEEATGQNLLVEPGAGASSSVREQARDEAPMPAGAPADHKAKQEEAPATRTAARRMSPSAPAPTSARPPAPGSVAGSVPESAKKRAEEPAAPAAPALRALLRHRNDGLLVLEITVAGELRWSPGDRVMIRLGDGREVDAQVHVAATTAAGTYQAGQVLRLVVDLGAAESASQPIAVRVAGLLLPIVME